jgi:spore maturation protein B
MQITGGKRKMKAIYFFNAIIIPFLIVGILLHGYIKKVDVFDVFVEGAKEGLETAIKTLPSLIGLICAVNVFKVSGILDIITYLWTPLEKITGFPSELLPIAVTKSFSSSASTGMLMDLFEKYGPDSYIGMTASIMMCCTETIFYTMSIYFSDVNIKDTRHILKCTFIGIIFGIWASMILGRIF